MSPEAGKYREPWWHLGGKKRTITDDEDEPVAIFEDGGDASRAAECVNALKGCPDPEDFIRSLRVMVEMAGESMEDQLRASGRLRHSSALAWLREGP